MSRNQLAFNSERLRQLLWERVAPSPEMLQKALVKLEEQLDAKETKFFTNQGLLVSQVDVEAHAIQQSAAVAIAKIADAMPRDRAEKAAPPSVTLEIKDGVFRIIVGASSREEDAHEVNHQNTSSSVAFVPEAQQLLDVTPPSDDFDVGEPPVQVVRMKDFVDRKTAMKLLMGDGADDGQPS